MCVRCTTTRRTRRSSSATLLERGEYRYDAHDHHGPTLYYLSLPAAALRGQATLASLDERTLRGVTAVFGAATILLLPWLSAAVGRTAVAASAVLMALSPAMTFYSRMFIQESLFTCFTLAFVIALGRVALGGGLAWTTLAGVAAGLAVATKETSVIVLPAALAACALSWLFLRSARHPLPSADGRSAVVGVAVAAAVAALFYSSFLAAPAGVLEPFRAVGTYLDRGIDPANHAHPWHYYLGLLAYSSSGGLRWSEGAVLALAVVGIGSAWRRPLDGAPDRPLGPSRSRPDASGPARAFWVRFLVGYVVLTAAVFSAIRYKTPWNLLPFYAGTIVLAGIGFSRLVHATASRAVAGVLIAGFAVASGHLGWQAWRASVTYAADPRNPYVYAHTVPDTVRLATRIRDVAALHPDGSRMQVSVIAPPLRTVAPSLVPAGDAARRLLERARRCRGPPGAGHRRVAGAHARAGRVARRSLRVGVLRPQAGSAARAVRRARVVGTLPGPCGRRRVGAGDRARRPGGP